MERLVLSVQNNQLIDISFHTNSNFWFVEIGFTFYRIPPKFMVNNWNKEHPENFRFAVKFSKVKNHDKCLK